MKPIKLIATGDLVLERRLHETPSVERPEVQSELARLRSADLALANLEQPLSSRGVSMDKWAALRGIPAIAQDLAEMGVGVVTIANNHMADYGPEALADTLSLLDEAGVPHCGAGLYLAQAMAPVILEREGWRIGIFGIASTLPIGSAATEDRPGVAPVRVTASFEIDPRIAAEQPGMVPIAHTTADSHDVAKWAQAIRALRSRVDYLIVSIHWGVPSFWMTPYGGVLAEYQRTLGHALIDAGADLVHGHHPHEPHGMEIYRGKLICYSLGNYIFAPPMAFMSPEAFQVEVALSEDREPGLAIRPLWINEAGLPAKPDREHRAWIAATLARLSTPLGVDLVPGEEGTLLPVQSATPARGKA